MRRVLFAWGLIVVTATAYVAQDPTRRPRLLFDQAHQNLFATLSGGYSRFASLARDLGFSVTENKTPFDAARLDSCDLLVIVNPRAAPEKAPVEEQTPVVHLTDCS